MPRTKRSPRSRQAIRNQNLRRWRQQLASQPVGEPSRDGQQFIPYTPPTLTTAPEPAALAGPAASNEGLVVLYSGGSGHEYSADSFSPTPFLYNGDDNTGCGNERRASTPSLSTTTSATTIDNYLAARVDDAGDGASLVDEPILLESSDGGESQSDAAEAQLQ